VLNLKYNRYGICNASKCKVKKPEAVVSTYGSSVKYAIAIYKATLRMKIPCLIVRA
jgi:hypothetical protein